VSSFGQVVNYYHDGIVAFAWGQFCYQITQDDFPAMIRDLIGYELACGGCWKGFCAVAKVTALVHHIEAHPWPPKVMHDGFLSKMGFPT